MEGSEVEGRAGEPEGVTKSHRTGQGLVWKALTYPRGEQDQ